MKEKENSDCCNLCKTTIIDDINYGPLFFQGKIAAHHFCLLFAPGLLQNGEDNEGFEGFLFKDVRNEVNRVKNLKCTFCKKIGANLGCCIKKCPKAFHTKCAIENNVIFEFTTKYRTYCSMHKKICQKDKKNLDPKCGICFDSLIKEYPAILAPCCKNSWFHKKCMQKFALSSALLFKCPLCGNKETEELKKLGIFFPERDAAWELETNAFEELYTPIQVSCENSKCENKFLHADEMHMWRICQFCGAGGVHEFCFKGGLNDKYTCHGCEEVLNRPKRVETIAIESDSSSDDEEMSPIKSSRERSIKRKIESDVSDEENEPPSKKINSKENEQVKQKSIANILLGESSASDESDLDCTLIIL